MEHIDTIRVIISMGPLNVDNGGNAVSFALFILSVGKKMPLAHALENFIIYDSAVRCWFLLRAVLSKTNSTSFPCCII